jgi:hypothetical protein
MTTRLLGRCIKRTPRSRISAARAVASRSLTLSSVNGALDPPLDNRTLPDYFSSCLLPSFADRPALVCRTEQKRPFGGPVQTCNSSYLRWTFAELDGHVEALARGLKGMGIRKGDRVAVIMGNNRYEIRA